MAIILELEKVGNSLYESPRLDVILITQDVVRTSGESDPFLEAGGAANPSWW